MEKPQPGEALPGREIPNSEQVMGMYLFARVEWRSLLRVRDTERHGGYILTGLRVMAYVHGFELYEDELAAVRQALGTARTAQK